MEDDIYRRELEEERLLQEQEDWEDWYNRRWRDVMEDLTERGSNERDE